MSKKGKDKINKKVKKPYKIPTITQKEKRKRSIKEYLLLLFPFLIFFVLIKLIFLIGIIPSGSMIPLMNTDSAIIANRLAYVFEEPERGDVIVFLKGDSYMTKRVIGIPGDSISIQNGIIYINEQPIIEEYLAEGITTEPISGINFYEVPENSFFLLGDNRIASNDSRAWEKPFIQKDQIVAKVLCVFSINPFTHGLYYKGVGDIYVQETYSGMPQYESNNKIVETEENVIQENETFVEVENKNNSPTLPAAAIEPEVITETELSAEEESSGNEATSFSEENEENDESATVNPLENEMENVGMTSSNAVEGVE